MLRRGPCVRGAASAGDIFEQMIELSDARHHDVVLTCRLGLARRAKSFQEAVSVGVIACARPKFNNISRARPGIAPAGIGIRMTPSDCRWHDSRPRSRLVFPLWTTDGKAFIFGGAGVTRSLRRNLGLPAPAESICLRLRRLNFRRSQAGNVVT